MAKVFFDVPIKNKEKHMKELLNYQILIYWIMITSQIIINWLQ